MGRQYLPGPTQFSSAGHSPWPFATCEPAAALEVESPLAGLNTASAWSARELREMTDLYDSDHSNV